MKKVLMGCGVLALLGALATAAMCVAGGAAVVEVAEQQEAERESLRAGATPDSFNFENFNFSMTGVETPGSIGERSFAETPMDGASFVVIRYRVENTSSETRTIVGNVTLVDAQGREFDEASRLTMALITADDDIEILSQLMPGLPKNQVAAFEVPTTSLASLQVKFGSPNMFEDMHYTFDLNL